jgi:hypothetical protein
VDLNNQRGEEKVTATANYRPTADLQGEGEASVYADSLFHIHCASLYISMWRRVHLLPYAFSALKQSPDKKVQRFHKLLLNLLQDGIDLLKG